MKIKIGLYKHKETGQFDVMIDQIDNTMKVHNGEFERIKTFEHHELTKEELLQKELNTLREEIGWRFDNDIKPIFYSGVSSDKLDDKKINGLREALYTFMCKRRELFDVIEFEYKGDN